MEAMARVRSAGAGDRLSITVSTMSAGRQPGLIGRSAGLHAGDFRPLPGAVRPRRQVRDRDAQPAARDARHARSAPPRSARAVLLGIAKPIPTDPPEGETIAEFMPITCAAMLNAGPPELPGLIGASSCRKWSNGPSPISLPSAEMIPSVNEFPERERVAGGQHPVAHLALRGIAPAGRHQADEVT